MSDSPYKYRPKWTFKVNGLDFHVIGFTEYLIEFDAADALFAPYKMCVILVDGKWELDESHRNTIVLLASAGLAKAVEAFFNEHGTPQIGKE